MNLTPVFTPRRPARASGIAAVARTLPGLLAAAALTLPLAGTVRAQGPGSIDPGFTPSLPVATVYATLFETNGINSIVLAGGDLGYLQTDLQPNGVPKGSFVAPIYGNISARIVFAAAQERFVGSGQTYPKVLLGGLFGQSQIQLYYKIPAQNITRITADGTQDSSFSVGGGANSYVTSILPLSAGGGAKIVVGGLFTTFNLEPRLRIVRLNNNGSIDATFNNSSVIDNDVLALAEGISPSTGQTDGTTYVGGTFNHVGGLPVTKLARLDASGNVDSNFRPVIDTRVLAIVVQPTGKIIIGGEFTRVNGVAVSRLARLNYDGSLDTSFLGSVSGLPAGESDPVAVYALKQMSAASNGKIYVGGNFTQIDGATRRYLGLINPNGTVGAFDPGVAIYDKVQSIFVQPNNGRVLVGETLGPKIGKVYQPSLIRLIGATTTN